MDIGDLNHLYSLLSVLYDFLMNFFFSLKRSDYIIKKSFSGINNILRSVRIPFLTIGIHMIITSSWDGPYCRQVYGVIVIFYKDLLKVRCFYFFYLLHKVIIKIGSNFCYSLPCSRHSIDTSSQC